MNATTTTPSRTVYLSKRGRKEYKKTISKLEQERRKVIAGLHEDDKIHNHDGRLDRIERLARLDAIEVEIEERRETLRIAQPLPQKKSNGILNSVTVGSEVELIDKGGDHLIYQIVDGVEADPSNGRVSAQSPLGQSLLGKTISDKISWAGLRAQTLRLVRIS